MEEWKEYKLGELTERKIGYGIVQPGEHVPNGIPVIKVNNIISGLKCISDLDRTSIENDEKYKRTRLNGGEVIISIVGTIGKTAIVPKQFAGSNLVRATALIDILDADKALWVKYYIDSPLGQAYIKGNLNTTVQPTLNIKSLIDMPIRMYSTEYMDKAIRILKSLDDKIEVNRRINEQLEELAQALFKSWFVDFEPFKDGEFVESELGMIPEGWKVVSLGELMKYSGGSQPPASEFIEEYKEGYIRFIQIRDYASESHITYIPISKKNKLCDVKDIMIARYGASLGRICYGLKGAYNVALAKVTPLKEYYREYLRCYLSSKEFYEGLNMKGNRAVQAGFNQGDIDSFMLSFPTNENIIMKYEAVSALLFEERLHNQQEIIHLTNLRDTLLPKLMSGEIDVNEVTI